MTSSLSCKVIHNHGTAFTRHRMRYGSYSVDRVAVKVHAARRPQ